jgi:hypothetical protein
LDPIDENHKACDGAMAAYLQFSEGPPGASDGSGSRRGDGNDDLLREVVRANAEMVKTIAEKIATVMESAATLLRAADGAGMPAREPAALPLQLATAFRNTSQPEVDDGDDDDDDDEPTGAGHLARILENVAAQAMPLVTHHVNTKVLGLTPEQSLAIIGGTTRALPPASAAPTQAQANAAPATVAGSAGPGEKTAPAPAAPSATDRSAGFLAHLMQIEQRLTPAETKLAHQAIQQMPPEALAAWKDRLLQLSPEQAVALIRGEIQRIAPDKTATQVKGAA